MFEYFETASRQERDEIAANLERLYKDYRDAENKTFLDMRSAAKREYNNAQKNYLYALGKLAAIQTVFYELHIPFE